MATENEILEDPFNGKPPYSFNVNELKKLCKKYGFKTKGNKDELVHRLMFLSIKAISKKLTIGDAKISCTEKCSHCNVGIDDYDQSSSCGGMCKNIYCNKCDKKKLKNCNTIDCESMLCSNVNHALIIYV